MASAAAASPADKPARPDFLPESYWDAEKGAPKIDLLNETFAERATRVARNATLPADPKAYALALPQNFELPKDQNGKAVEWKFDENDPAIARAREWAHGRKLSQDEFSEALGLYAAKELQREQEFKAYHASEIKKLGDAGPTRVDAVLTWAKAVGGDALAQTIKDMAYKADHIKAFEGLMTAFASPVGTRFSAANRETAEDAGKIPGFVKMTFEQRRAAQLQRTATGR